ncbi:MAG TPA: winged helix-turn-helix domain-containing protein [Vicinamibacterales bacterium]|nr:winged helix-turn-helix domain-containing protein [Vicinamibacterales bacterium]
MALPGYSGTLRFGDFVLDVAAYELRRDGRRVRLERQPMDLLILLVAQRGQLVSRSQIVDALWGADVFVDVENGVNTAIRKLRQALRDTPDAPRFIETVPGKGYRFIAAVEILPDAAASPPPVAGARSVVVGGETFAAGDEIAPNRASVAVPEPVVGEPAAGRRASVRLAVGALTLAALAGALLWAWQRPVESGAPVTIAVLPFDNLTGAAETDYLASGLTEDTIVSLGRIDPERVSVIGRTSMIAYRGTTKSLAEIGRELGTDYLVESSLRAEGSHLRITARLIRVRDQVQIWSDSFDSNASSILGLQQEISSAIAEQVRTRLSPERQRALARRHTQNAEAYDFFLRGRHFLNQRTPEAMQRAIDSFQRATVADPAYSLAWANLAMAYGTTPINSDVDPRRVSPAAREAVVRAVAANPDVAEAQHALGHVNWAFEWDWPAAEAAFRRAIELDRSYSLVHLILAHLLSQTGRHAEAEPLMRRGRELDPLNPLSYALSSQVSFQARDYAGALQHANRAIALDQEFWIGHQMRGQALEELGDDDLALKALATAARLSGQNSKPISLTGYILGRAGRTAEARDLLGALEMASRQRYVPPYALALVHAGLGDADAAFEWLNRAYAARDVHLMFLTVDVKWDRYRSDPRFGDLLARCGFTTIGTRAGTAIER